MLLRSSGTFYSLTNWTTKPQVPTPDTPSKSKSLFWTLFVTSETMKNDHVEDFEGWVTWVFSRALPTTRVCWPWSSDGPVVPGDRSCQVISDKLIVCFITFYQTSGLILKMTMRVWSQSECVWPERDREEVWVSQCGTHHTRSQVVHTIPEHRKHKQIARETEWHIHSETSTYLQTHTCDICKKTHTCALRSTHHMI